MFPKMIGALFLIATLAAGPAAAHAQSNAVAPTIEGPITGGKRGYPYAASSVDLRPFGYTEAEYFISGVAHPFVPAAGTTLTADGRWQVAPGADAPFKTRILVRKPPASRFNGTVVVEFMQEYFGTERDTNYQWNAENILRQGFGWVGVSLHRAGVDDPTPQQTITYGETSFTTGQNLARWDHDRYGGLSIPNSDLSFDILTQVGLAVGPARKLQGVDPFAGLKIRKVMAVGNTIAAQRLAIYINGVQPLTQAFDGFYLQDLSPGELKLSGDVPTPTGIVRTDVKAPVIVLETDTAAVKVGVMPEGPNLRFWHPAGSSHTTGAFMARVAKQNERDLGMTGGFCDVNYANTYPVQYLSGAAIVAVAKRANGGPALASFPQLARLDENDAGAYFDKHGNVVGGLRSPWVDVPIARYDWRGECTGGSGRTYPFTAAELSALYGTPKAYQRAFKAAVRKAQKNGTLLPQDAAEALRQAQSVTW